MESDWNGEDSLSTIIVFDTYSTYQDMGTIAAEASN